MSKKLRNLLSSIELEVNDSDFSAIPLNENLLQSMSAGSNSQCTNNSCTGGKNTRCSNTSCTDTTNWLCQNE